MRHLLPFRLLALCLLVAAVAGCSHDAVAVGQDHMKKGDAYVAEKKFREAIIEYRGAVSEMPRSPTAHYKLAEAYSAVGEVQNALPSYLRAVDLNPDLTDAGLKAGNLLLLARKFEDARARARAILAKQPENSSALLLLGNALAGLRSFDEAVAANERAIALDPKRAGVYVNLGALEYIRGNQKEAEAAYRAAIAADSSSVEAHNGLGSFFWLSGRLKEAETEFKTALGLEPTTVETNRLLASFYISLGRALLAEPYLVKITEVMKTPESRFALADYYLGTGRIDKALEMLTTLRAEKQNSATATIKLALVNFARGKRADASTMIEEVLKNDPKNATALAFKAHMLLSEGKRLEAATVADAAVAADPQSVRAQYARGVVARANGRLEAAKEAFQIVLQLNPSATEAQMELAQIHLAANQVDTAVGFAEQAVRSNPADVEAQLVLIRVLASRPEWAKRAETALQTLATRFPTNASVQTELGRLALAKGDMLGATKAFTRAVELDPSAPEPLLELVGVDMAAGREADARRRIELALSKFPNSSELLLVAGKTYANSDPKAAEQHLRKAIELDGTNIEAYQTLGALFLVQRRMPEAKAEFMRLADRQPSSIQPATMVGILAEAMGNIPEAQQWYQRALRIDPRAPTAANNLAWLFAEQGENLEEALQLAQIAHAELPKQLEVSDTLGWVYYKKGMFALAIRTFKDCVQIEPRNPIYQYHLGLAHAGNAEDKRARVALETALRLNPNFRFATEARRALQKLMY